MNHPCDITDFSAILDKHLSNVKKSARELKAAMWRMNFYSDMLQLGFGRNPKYFTVDELGDLSTLPDGELDIGIHAVLKERKGRR